VYIRKSILILILLLNVVLFSYVVLENRVIFARSLEAETAFNLELEPHPPVAEPAAVIEPLPDDGEWQAFEATAYSVFGITKSGVWVRRGIIAVDPRVVPLGSIVEIQGESCAGIYTAMDTGPEIQGREVDIYMPTGQEAIRFGRRNVRLKLIRRGWDPAGPFDAAMPPAGNGP
jgi:3D (Asp-Asp-Asp) domain-containing protein